jgi:hypothetical protein
MPRHILTVRALRVISFALPARKATSATEWPTTQRFSRRLGERVRDADYAAAIEGPAGQPLVLLDPEGGLLPFLLRMLDRLRSLLLRP